MIFLQGRLISALVYGCNQKHSPNAQTMGKEVGDDLSEGKTTLPIIYALKNTTAKRNRKKQ
jgi:hypothetical protein